MENACIARASERRRGPLAPGDLASGHRALAELASEERAERFSVGGLRRPIVFQVLRDMMRSRQLSATEMPDDGVQIVTLVRAHGLVLRDARDVDVEGVVRVVLRTVLE